jgi:hypothetical protein
MTGGRHFVMGTSNPDSPAVIPAQAGIQLTARASFEMDPCLRRDDIELVAAHGAL